MARIDTLVHAIRALQMIRTYGQHPRIVPKYS